MNSSRRGFIGASVLDVALANAAVYIVFHLRFGGNIPASNFEPFVRLIPFMSIVLVGLFWSFGLYTRRTRHYSEIIYNISLSVLILNVFTAAMTFFLRGFSFPRYVLVLGGFMQLGLLSVWRCFLQYMFEQSEPKKTVAIIGANSKLDDVFSNGLYSLLGKKHEIKDVVSGESFDEVEKAIKTSTVICINGSVSQSLKERIVALSLEQDKEVILIPSIYEIMMHKVTMDSVDDVAVFRIEPLEIQPIFRLLKRCFDFAASLIGLIVLSPLFIFLAVVIPLNSPGPVFYKQPRVGQGGTKFKVIKFRTMVKDAEKVTGPVFAAGDDPRITKVGKWLRKTRLDEFPQLINVLKGEMSLVGPRPERPYFVQQFADEIPAYEYRLKVKPGITGLAQIMGCYDTLPEDKLRYDLYYIKNYSPWLDFQILLQTLRIPFKPQSARGVTKQTEALSGRINLPGQ